MKAAERESEKAVSGAGELCGVDWLWVLPLTAALIALAVIFHPLQKLPFRFLSQPLSWSLSLSSARFFKSPSILPPTRKPLKTGKNKPLPHDSQQLFDPFLQLGKFNAW